MKSPILEHESATIAATDHKPARRERIMGPSRRALRGLLITVLMRLRGRLLRLADRLMPPPALLLERSTGIAQTMVVGEVARLGVADLVRESPHSAEELADRIGVNADALHRTLRAACTLGLFAMDDSGHFSTTPLGRTLEQDGPQSLRAWAIHSSSAEITAAWADLGETVRTGRNAFRRVHGASIREWYDAHPQEARLFAAAMRDLSDSRGSLADIYPFPARSVVADIRGGAGTLLAQLVADRPDVCGILVDGSRVLDEAAGFLDSRGLRDRIELREGDVFSHYDVTADVYLLKGVLHDWDDASCAQILRVVAAAMPVGATLIVIEGDQPRNQAVAGLSVRDVHMMLLAEGGRERSEAELRQMLREAGLATGLTYRLPPWTVLVTAFKPPCESCS